MFISLCMLLLKSIYQFGLCVQQLSSQVDQNSVQVNAKLEATKRMLQEGYQEFNNGMPSVFLHCLVVKSFCVKLNDCLGFSLLDTKSSTSALIETYYFLNLDSRVTDVVNSTRIAAKKQRTIQVVDPQDLPKQRNRNLQPSCKPRNSSSNSLRNRLGIRRWFPSSYHQCWKFLTFSFMPKEPYSLSPTGCCLYTLDIYRSNF